MKNLKLFILLFLSIYSSEIFSQEKTDRGFMSITVGLSKNLIEQSSDNLYVISRLPDGSKVGMKNRLTFNSTFGYDLFPNLGFAISLQRMGLKVNAHKELFRGWVIESAVAGPYFTYKYPGSLVSYDVRLLMGFMHITNPMHGKNALYSTKINYGYGLAYQVSLAGRFPVNKRISLVLGLHYYSANPAWDFGGAEIEENLSTFNVNFGVAGRLWK